MIDAFVPLVMVSLGVTMTSSSLGITDKAIANQLRVAGFSTCVTAILIAVAGVFVNYAIDRYLTQ